MEKTPNTLQDKAIGVRDFFAGENGSFRKINARS